MFKFLKWQQSVLQQSRAWDVEDAGKGNLKAKPLWDACTYGNIDAVRAHIAKHGTSGIDQKVRPIHGDLRRSL